MQLAISGNQSLAMSGMLAGGFLDSRKDALVNAPLMREKTVPEFDLIRAKKLSPAEQNHIGYRHSLSERKAIALKQAAKWFHEAAKASDAVAQYNYGSLYYLGEGGKNKNYNEAFKWFNASADQGFANAFNMMGVMHLLGEGIEKDYQQAKTCFERAIELGLEASKNNLGILYENGYGVEQDYAKAQSLYEAAVKTGAPEALSNLGKMYGSATADELHYRKAFELFTNASEKKYPRAFSFLGVMYYNGEWVRRDFKKAEEHFRFAAEKNDIQGQLCLGLMLLNGSLGKINKAEGHKWLKKAAAQGDKLVEFAMTADLSPIVIDEFTCLGKKITAKGKFELYPTLQHSVEEDGSIHYCLLDRELGLHSWSPTRDGLIEAIKYDLDFIWSVFVHKPDDRLDTEALGLKKLLLANFSEES